MAGISNTDLIINKDGSVYHLNLKPGQVSDTIIAVGDPSRVYAVSQHFSNVDFEMNTREFITHTGWYKKKNITVISTGIGTDNVEIFFTELDALFNIDLKKREPKTRKKKLQVIRVGTSGSLQEDIKINSQLVSEYSIGLDALMFYYDLPQTTFEKKFIKSLQKEVNLPYKPYMVSCSKQLKEKIGHDMVSGIAVTTPGFYAPQGRQIRLDIHYPNLLENLSYFHKDGLWLTNFEMESAAYYALGRLMGHDVLSVNLILANRISNQFSSRANEEIDKLIIKVLDRI